MSQTLDSIEVVLATGNLGKVRDFQHLVDAAGQPIKVHSMQAFGGMPEVEECETTFAGNARLKAQAARAMIPISQGLWTLADDSGLSVDALNGAPGVQSARFAGVGASDADNREKLLRALDGVAMQQRSAHFNCHLCLISPKGLIFDFEGIRRGYIALQSRGLNGFGYDPLFIPEGFEKTWGELPEEQKNGDSHRGHAMKQLLDWIIQRAF